MAAVPANGIREAAMAFREVRVFEVREVLRLWLSGEGVRFVERLAQVDRKTVRRYSVAAEAFGVVRGGGDGQLSDAMVGVVVEAVRPHRCDGHGEAWRLLVAHHDDVAGWVAEDLTGVKIAELLERRGVVVPVRTVQRYLHEVCGRRRGRARNCDCRPIWATRARRSRRSLRQRKRRCRARRWRRRRHPGSRCRVSNGSNGTPRSGASAHVREPDGGIEARRPLRHRGQRRGGRDPGSRRTAARAGRRVRSTPHHQAGNRRTPASIRRTCSPALELVGRCGGRPKNGKIAVRSPPHSHGSGRWPCQRRCPPCPTLPARSDGSGLRSASTPTRSCPTCSAAHLSGSPPSGLKETCDVDPLTIPLNPIDEMFIHLEDPTRPITIQLEARVKGRVDDTRLREAVHAAAHLHQLARARVEASGLGRQDLLLGHRRRAGD